MEAGKRRLMGDTKRQATSGKVVDLRKENGQLKVLVADLSLKNCNSHELGMAVQIDLARGAVYIFAWMLDHPDDCTPTYSASMISKTKVVRVFAADTAV